ncbi:signal peptide protein [Hyphomicrobium nitrativorans NL23]|uniref:Signal peptide protein n=1 Tax=Hyphomicrobium nitrativorans NL23 TaxID=1029756 RepID=V5SB61_9HYPH|nr:signal peptide protein [Hyphomicrobium nitrativorans NL23]
MRRFLGGPLACAGVLCAVGALLLASAAHGRPLVAGAVLVGSLGEAWMAVMDWIAASYARAPALVLGLTALVAAPPLALVGFLFLRRDAEADDIAELETQLIQRGRGGDEPEPRDAVRTGHVALRPLAAWVEVLNGNEVAPDAEPRYGLPRALILRIGRESDNDVQLTHTTVHRYHAAIHRTEDAEFVITDLSSVDGNGVVVNGRAVAEARLANGDVIELGKARLKFSTAPAV